MLVDYREVQISQANNHILQDVGFKVDEGGFIYIIGKVDSDKDSLLETMYCELDIESDSDTKAEVLDRDIIKVKRNEVPALRKEMGIIFRDFQLLHDRDAYKNLYFALKTARWKDRNGINQRIGEVLNDVGMIRGKHKMPYELSGGEQQHIVTAGALLNKSKVIIANEPTGNLDSETVDHIVELLKDITRMGTAVVISTRNIPVLDKFPGIVYRCKNEHIEDITNEYNKIDLQEEAESDSQLCPSVE